MSNISLTPYGETLSSEERRQWFNTEREAYVRIRPARGYPYHAANRRYGFVHLPEKQFRHVLGFGAGDGDELLPLTGRFDEATLLDASSTLKPLSSLFGSPCHRAEAHPEGHLPFPANHIDLITCLGVLHHIPRISTVLEEFFRVLEPGGFVLIREPIVSMGDASKPRKGLTPHERGIPVDWLVETTSALGFRILTPTFFQFLPLSLLCDRLNIQPYNSEIFTGLDRLLCRIFPGSGRYHRTRIHHHLAPTSIFLVLQKPCD
jgi:SAM-dependent methyltransferase